MSNQEKEIREAISKRFTQMRLALGLNHQQLADGLYIARTTYTRYESGTFIPSIHTLNLLSSRFNVSLDWLLTGKGSMFLPKNDKPAPPPIEISEEEKEMLETMKTTPILRYKILLFFQEQKSQFKDQSEK